MMFSPGQVCNSMWGVLAKTFNGFNASVQVIKWCWPPAVSWVGTWAFFEDSWWDCCSRTIDTGFQNSLRLLRSFVCQGTLDYWMWQERWRWWMVGQGGGTGMMGDVMQLFYHIYILFTCVCIFIYTYIQYTGSMELNSINNWNAKICKVLCYKIR